MTARVLEGIAAHPEAFVEAPTLAADGALPVASPDQEAAAAEQAFTTAGALADVLLMCVHAPLTRTGTGAVSAVDRKRLVETGAVNSAEELDDLVDSAAGAGLLRSLGREWLVTPAGDHWLEETTTTRWTTIVRGLVSALPRGLRAADGTIFSPQEWPAAYPLDPDWAARAERLERIAHRWGFLSPDGSIPAWTRQLLAGEIPDAAALAKYLPAEIDKVYLQADLTAIAPGPLAPALDLRLRGIARRESRAQASSYRFTAESIGAGMTEGEIGRVDQGVPRRDLADRPAPTARVPHRQHGAADTASSACRPTRSLGARRSSASTPRSVMRSPSTRPCGRSDSSVTAKP